MDKRFFLALVLTALVIVATPLLFPNATRRSSTPVTSDSSARRTTVAPDSLVRPPGAASVVGSSAVATSTTPVGGINSSNTTSNVSAAETTTVHAQRTTYAFTSRGAAPVSVTLDSYPSRRPRGAQEAKRSTELVGPHGALTHYRVALGRDTIALDSVSLKPAFTTGATPTLAYDGDVGGHPARLLYTFSPDSYLVHVTARIDGAPQGSALLLELPRTLQSNEPDTLDDMNHLAVSYRPSKGEVNSVNFGKLDTTTTRNEAGPLDWVATRNKYFLVAYRAPANAPFSALRMQGGSRIGKVTPAVRASAALPIAADGSVAFDIYAGPQDFERLIKLGGDLDQVNPYAGWLHGVVQPFATVVMKALLWMKHTTKLNYGWVLVLFGVIIRLVLWPLNQGAMRTSMKMQRLQPELQAVQKKNSADPKKQQEAIMKIYKDHGMSPLSPLMGCLPMLLPMPVLFALYFVFQNTIEFRGVSFLWLPDISLHDPYYITPLLMGVSMFVMSWIGMRNAPPNPQAKMMSYMMPVMLTVLFINFASGLNLYYAVQNIAALPQQWLLARERAKTAALPVVSGTPTSTRSSRRA